MILGKTYLTLSVWLFRWLKKNISGSCIQTWSHIGVEIRGSAHELIEIKSIKKLIINITFSSSSEAKPQISSFGNRAKIYEARLDCQALTSLVDLYVMLLLDFYLLISHRTTKLKPRFGSFKVLHELEPRLGSFRVFLKIYKNNI